MTATKRMPMVTREQVLSMIDVLEDWLSPKRDETARDTRVELWPCPTCGAKPGEPCVRRNGKPVMVSSGERMRITYQLTGQYQPLLEMFGHHAPRIDKCLRGINYTGIEVLRSDLVDWNDPPTKIFARIRKTKLYKRLVEVGKLQEPA